jgi:hypothetical protein
MSYFKLYALHIVLNRPRTCRTEVLGGGSPPMEDRTLIFLFLNF